MSLSKRNVGILTIVYIFKVCFSITEEKSFITLAPGGSLSGCGTWVKIGIATIIVDCPNEAIELKTKSFFYKTDYPGRYLLIWQPCFIWQSGNE